MAGKEGGSMLQVLPYDRAAAVAYAHRWAVGRNPQLAAIVQILPPSVCMLEQGS